MYQEILPQIRKIGRQAGMTLLELIIACAILLILASAAMPISTRIMAITTISSSMVKPRLFSRPPRRTAARPAKWKFMLTNLSI